MRCTSATYGVLVRHKYLSDERAHAISFIRTPRPHNEHFCFIKRATTESTEYQIQLSHRPKKKHVFAWPMSAVDGAVISCCYSIPAQPVSLTFHVEIQRLEHWLENTSQVWSSSLWSRQLPTSKWGKEPEMLFSCRLQFCVVSSTTTSRLMTMIYDWIIYGICNNLSAVPVWNIQYSCDNAQSPFTTLKLNSMRWMTHLTTTHSLLFWLFFVYFFHTKNDDYDDDWTNFIHHSHWQFYLFGKLIIYPFSDDFVLQVTTQVTHTNTDIHFVAKTWILTLEL